MAQLKEIKLHDLGEGLDGGKLIEWHVSEKDSIREGDLIASIETSKSIVELPAPMTGIVEKLNVSADSVVNTGTTIAQIQIESEEKNNNQPLVGKPIHATHVLPNETTMRTSQENLTKPMIPSSNLMIKNMTLAKKVVAATLFDEMPIDELDPNINITAQMVFKLANALSKNPKLNAHFDTNNHELTEFKNIHLGIAFNDRDDHLKVPVIGNVEKLSIEQIVAIIASIKKDGMASPFIDNHIPSPTFTLTNIGSIGAKYGTPVLIPPCVGILAIGRKECKPIVKNNEIVIGNLIPVSLTFDHRILTGAQAASFLIDFCNPGHI
ncbi:MAG: 2-oxo acid dehydrogenase subunit E2 [Gammaproteobacteria bacterium]|nr:2-oxo acid dehydrogenase subunit E2 [Gammaproteobacteria bacterium]